MYNLLAMAILAAISQQSMACDKDGISGADLPKMRTGFTLSNTAAIDQAIERAKERHRIIIQQKIVPTLRKIPVEMLIMSGFTAEDQSNEELAGCYIRLGSTIRSLEDVPRTLAATAFLNSGLLYAQDARTADGDLRADLLISAAQNYYWAFCNENSNPVRKETIKGVAKQYCEYSLCSLTSLSDNQLKDMWHSKIKDLQSKLG